MKNFDFDNKDLQNQFDSIEWIENSGLGEEELLSKFNALMKRDCCEKERSDWNVRK